MSFAIYEPTHHYDICSATDFPDMFDMDGIFGDPIDAEGFNGVELYRPALDQETRISHIVSTSKSTEEAHKLFRQNMDLFSYVDHLGFNLLALVISASPVFPHNTEAADAVLAIQPDQINGTGNAFSHFSRINNFMTADYLIMKGFHDESLIREHLARKEEALARLARVDHADSASMPM